MPAGLEPQPLSSSSSTATRFSIRNFYGEPSPNFQDPSIAGVWGERREMRTADSIYNALFDLDWNAQPGFSPYFGGDALVRREALEEVGGYNENLIAGEEPEMCRRMREARLPHSSYRCDR